MKQEKWECEPMRAVETLSRPRFATPRGACDAHLHVFGPLSLYPPVPDALYELPDGDLGQYLAVAAVLGVERMVLVQPSFYGVDNRVLLETLDRLGPRGRGVVFLPEEPDPGLLEDYDRRGVRGVRLNLFKAVESGQRLGEIAAMIERRAEMAAALGWHLELYAPGAVVRGLLERLAALKVDFSVNHMGYMTAEEGLGEADFQAFLELARTPNCWVKLSAPYRVEKTGSARTDGMARQLIEAAPQRLVWGSDWPHIPYASRDTGALLNRLDAWCADPRVRDGILVANPARLYRFD